MYKNTYIFDGLNLGHTISMQDDIFKAVDEGRQRTEMIARALKPQIPTIVSGDVEIHCASYDPQLWLDDSWMPPVQHMAVGNGIETLQSMKAKKKKKEA